MAAAEPDACGDHRRDRRLDRCGTVLSDRTGIHQNRLQHLNHDRLPIPAAADHWRHSVHHRSGTHLLPVEQWQAGHRPGDHPLGGRDPVPAADPRHR